MTNKKGVFNITLEMGGKSYKSQAETIDKALTALNLSWEQIKYKGVIKISQNKKTLEHLFYLGQLRRIFANKVARFIWAKRLALLLDEQK